MQTPPTTTTRRHVPTLSGAPLLGNLLEFRADRIALQRRAADECGDLGYVRLGPIKALLVSSAAIAHEVLTEKADAFVKSPGLGKFARPMLGDGLLTSEHEKHRRNRKLMAPAFQHKRIAAYADAMAGYAERTAASWTDGAHVDLTDEMMKLTLAIVGKTLFDADVEAAEAHAIGEALTVAMQYIVQEVTRLVHFPMSWPVPRNVRYRRAIGQLDEVVYRIIRARRAAGGDRGDVLSMLLLARDEDGAQLDDTQVRDEAITLLLAGHETTANALAWAGMLLAQHPDVYDRLADEADRALGGRTARFEDLARLPYAMMVLKESMRLFPPAYIVGRMTERPVAVGGVELPKGALVFVNVFGMHHRADYFRDPERFDPERFAPDAEKALPKGAYLPFGGGPRVCIGNHFALMEGQLILATLAARARLTLLTNAPIRTEPLITLRPLGGVPMRITRRAPWIARAA
jgi:cytochrome P450